MDNEEYIYPYDAPLPGEDEDDLEEEEELSFDDDLMNKMGEDELNYTGYPDE